MTILTTIIAFIVALGVLITFHELGHYWVARWSGVKVLRFSIGFGRPLFKKLLGKDQTEWVVAALPLGGYVKMLDEREGEVSPHELSRAFNQQSVYKRFAIVAAGPIANFLLAILLYWILFILGVNGVKPIIGPIKQATPVAFAAFEEGEVIQKIAGESVATWQDARWELLTQAVDRNPGVVIETINLHGQTALRTLDLSQIHTDDLDANFLESIGFIAHQLSMDAIIGQVIVGGVGHQAGLKEGDEILAINQTEILRWEELVREIRANPGQLLELEVLRQGQIIDVMITPESVNENGQKVGKVGIAPKIDPGMVEKYLVNVSYSPLTAFYKACWKTWEMTAFTFRMLGKMLIGEVSWKNVSGPITIADYAGQSAQMGFASFLGFLALISVSLAVLNLLPIPVLDGGHLMYYLIEFIRGSPLSEKTMEIGQQIGMGLLLTLMIFAVYNDIYRLVAS